MQFNRHFEPVYSKAEFYDTAKARSLARRRSREIDFGVMWRDQDFPGRYYRLTWVMDTGEFVEVYNDETTVLGVVVGEEASEAVLKGWAEVCPRGNSLAWVRDRLEEAGAATLWMSEGYRRVSSGFELWVDAQERSLAVTYTNIGGESGHGGFTMLLSRIPELIDQGRVLLREIAAHSPQSHRVADTYTLVADLSCTLVSLDSGWGPVICQAAPWEFEALLCGLSAWLDEVYESLGE